MRPGKGARVPGSHLMPGKARDGRLPSRPLGTQVLAGFSTGYELNYSGNPRFPGRLFCGFWSKSKLRSNWYGVGYSVAYDCDDSGTVQNKLKKS